jgi:biopolymer transport protein ExbB
MNAQLGFVHFLVNSDWVAKLLLCFMLIASIVTWYVIIRKTLTLQKQKQKSASFLTRFWQAKNLESVAQEMRQQAIDNPFAHLVHQGFGAAETLRKHEDSPQGLIATASPDEFLTRALKRALDEDKGHLEYGQTWLASVASSAPFVGLLGTVWGIYHALVNIGTSGQSSLDKVAGPVGEALIMTGIGLAVAIPAALAYNFFNRANRNIMSQLNSFAHDVYALLSTGMHGKNNTNNSSNN